MSFDIVKCRELDCKKLNGATPGAVIGAHGYEQTTSNQTVPGSNTYTSIMWDTNSVNIGTPNIALELDQVTLQNTTSSSHTYLVSYGVGVGTGGSIGTYFNALRLTPSVGLPTGVQSAPNTGDTIDYLSSAAMITLAAGRTFTIDVSCGGPAGPYAIQQSAATFLNVTCIA